MMNSKNYADVLIDGKIYTLGGAEEENYLQQVASHINEKLSELRKQEGFTKQSEDYQAVMAYLNLADDYFKEKDRANTLSAERDGLEKENYSLKHELVSTQMKLEVALRDVKDLKEALQKEADKAEDSQE